MIFFRRMAEKVAIIRCVLLFISPYCFIDNTIGFIIRTVYVMIVTTFVNYRYGYSHLYPMLVFVVCYIWNMPVCTFFSTNRIDK
jgi:uncharacterized membrane protein YagU involved in acid resistance